MNLGATINSASADFVPAFSPDGHWMFFASDRPGGFGRADIWQSYRAGRPRRFRLADADQPRPERQHRRRRQRRRLLRQRRAPAAVLRKRPARAARQRRPLRERPSARRIVGPGDADPGAQQPGHRQSADHPPRRAGDLLLLGSRRRSRGQRSVDVDASHRRRALVDAGQPRRDREQQRQRAPPVPVRGRRGRSSSPRTRPGGLGGADLYMTTRAAKLTVTANDQSQAVRPGEPAADVRDQRLRRRRDRRRSCPGRRRARRRRRRRARPATTRSRARSAR